MRYVFLLCLMFTTSAFAEDSLSAANAAVVDILFEYDGSEEYASYAVKESGHVDLTFASNTPDALYVEILTKMQNDPAISSVLVGRGGAVCPLFP